MPAGIGYGGFLGGPLSVGALARATQPYVSEPQVEWSSSFGPDPHGSFQAMLHDPLARLGLYNRAIPAAAAAANSANASLRSVESDDRIIPGDSRRADSLIGAMLAQQKMGQRNQQQQTAARASVMQNFLNTIENRRAAALETNTQFEPLGQQSQNAFAEMFREFGGDPAILASIMQEGGGNKPPSLVENIEGRLASRNRTTNMAALKSELDKIAARAEPSRQNAYNAAVGFGATGLPRDTTTVRPGQSPDVVAKQLLDVISRIEDPETKQAMSVYVEKLLRRSPSLSEFLGQ